MSRQGAGRGACSPLQISGGAASKGIMLGEAMGMQGKKYLGGAAPPDAAGAAIWKPYGAVCPEGQTCKSKGLATFSGRDSVYTRILYDNYKRNMNKFPSRGRISAVFCIPQRAHARNPDPMCGGELGADQPACPAPRSGSAKLAANSVPASQQPKARAVAVACARFEGHFWRGSASRSRPRVRAQRPGREGVKGVQRGRGGR